jgi:hypothetical protein
MQSCLDHQAETKFGRHYEQGEEFYRTSSDSDRSQWGQHHHSKRSSYEESAKRHPVSHDRASNLPSTLGTKSTIGHPTQQMPSFRENYYVREAQAKKI